MQRLHINMQDIRNKLEVKSLRWKVEKSVLQRIGHVLRMENDKPTKTAVFAWLTDIDQRSKRRGKSRKQSLFSNHKQNSYQKTDGIGKT